jgi:cytochrome c-type biogenesis protein
MARASIVLVLLLGVMLVSSGCAEAVVAVGGLLGTTTRSEADQLAAPGSELQTGSRLMLAGDAPDFTLEDTTGSIHTLSSYRGKVVLLNFMATWCLHCWEQAPLLNTIAETYKSRDVQFFSIHSSEYGEIGANSDPTSMEHLALFHRTYGLSFPLLWDKGEKVGLGDYGVAVYPTIYIVGKDGRIGSVFEFVEASPFTPPPADLTTVRWRLKEELERLLK